MDNKQMKSILESILFAVGEPVGLSVLADALEISQSAAKSLLDEMKSEYDYNMRGIKLVRMDNKYQFVTRGENFEYIKKILKDYNASSLSQAALETLAIIAYKQPVTRAEIEQIRGVQSSSSVDVLIDRGIVKKAGKLDVPGKPIAYETTPEFLKLMNIEKIAFLPDYAQFSEEHQFSFLEPKENTESIV